MLFSNIIQIVYTYNTKHYIIYMISHTTHKYIHTPATTILNNNQSTPLFGCHLLQLLHHRLVSLLPVFSILLWWRHLLVFGSLPHDDNFIIPTSIHKKTSYHLNLNIYIKPQSSLWKCSNWTNENAVTISKI